MSYDLMVFALEHAPQQREPFLAWYQQQSQWKERHSYDDPQVTTPELRAWFQEMIQEFPPLDGPLAPDIEAEDFDEELEDRLTGYCIGKSVIYASFAWSEAEMAYRHVKDLAARHKVGFFDASSNSLEIWLPTPEGNSEKVTT